MELCPKVCKCTSDWAAQILAQRAIVADHSLTKISGYDEGGFSASIKLPKFVEDFNLVPANWEHDASGLANRKANISSFQVLGAAFGALSGLDLNDRLGRMVSWRLGVVVWAIGTLIQIFSSGIYGLLLFARIFAGLGAGLLTVTAPMYLTEVAPRKTRGLAVGLTMVTLLGILALGMHACTTPQPYFLLF